MRRPIVVSVIVLGLVAAASYGWMTIRRGFSARDDPSVIEAYVAKTARTLSIPASARNAKNPFVSTPKSLMKRVPHFR